MQHHGFLPSSARIQHGEPALRPNWGSFSRRTRPLRPRFPHGSRRCRWTRGSATRPRLTPPSQRRCASRSRTSRCGVTSGQTSRSVPTSCQLARTSCTRSRTRTLIPRSIRIHWRSIRQGGHLRKLRRRTSAGAQVPFLFLS